MTLSILIPSLESRFALLIRLTAELKKQIGSNENVEILTNIDNKEKTTGRKRQELLERASGDYVIFIDDDDEVTSCYVSELLKAAASGADCFAINGYMTTDGGSKIEWRISKDYDNVTIRERGRKVYLRHTNHITAVKRLIALRSGFPDKSNAEDKAYSEGLRGLLHTEYVIKSPMYHYKFTTNNKEYA